MRWSNCGIPTWLKSARFDGVEDIIMGYFIYFNVLLFCVVLDGLSGRIQYPLLFFGFGQQGSVMMMLALSSIELIRIQFTMGTSIDTLGLLFCQFENNLVDIDANYSVQYSHFLLRNSSLRHKYPNPAKSHMSP